MITEILNLLDDTEEAMQDLPQTSAEHFTAKADMILKLAELRNLVEENKGIFENV